MKSFIFRSIIFSLFAFLISFGLTIVTSENVAAQLINKNLIAKKHNVVAQVGKINNTNNSGVSRISVYLLSTPNTSDRIDSASIINGKEILKASDIDGIDFGRSFQWEENGEIEVEVDFPLRKKFDKNAVIIFHSVYGDIKAPIKKKLK